MPSKGPKHFEPTTADPAAAKRQRALRVIQGRKGDTLPHREAARVAAVSATMIRNLRRELGLSSPIPPVGQRVRPKSGKVTKKTPAPPVAKAKVKTTRSGKAKKR